jgi:dsDNA-specific endonuclease/ATPase MutS2
VELIILRGGSGTERSILNEHGKENSESKKKRRQGGTGPKIVALLFTESP